MIDGLIRGIGVFLSHIDPNVAAALIAAVVALFGYGYNQRRARGRELAEAHRPQKMAAYDHFLSIVRFLQYNVTGEGTPRQKSKKDREDLAGYYKEFTRGLIEWGSPKVIKQWMAFRKVVTPKGSKELLFAMDDMLREIRRDLGLSNRGLARGDLFGLLVKPPDVQGTSTSSSEE